MESNATPKPEQVFAMMQAGATAEKVLDTVRIARHLAAAGILDAAACRPCRGQGPGADAMSKAETQSWHGIPCHEPPWSPTVVRENDLVVVSEMRL